MTALEAFTDLYRTLPEEAGAGWLADSLESGLDAEVRNPWES